MGAQLSIVKDYLPTFFSNEYTGSTHFNELPEDLHVLIFSLLEIPTQIRIRAVCRQWRNQIENAFFKPVRHLSLFIIDPGSTPKQKEPTNSVSDSLPPKYEYYAGNEQFGSRESSFLYVDDIAASLAKPPTIEEIVLRNRNHGYKVHQLIEIDEGRLGSVASYSNIISSNNNNKNSKEAQPSAFVKSFCRMLTGIFQNNNNNNNNGEGIRLEELSVYASRKHLPLQPSFSWGLDEWQHYKWSFTHSRAMTRKFQELEEAPLRPVDVFLAAVIRALADLRVITLNYDCSYIFQLSSMSGHIAALAEHRRLKELKLHFNLGDSRCLLYEKKKADDDADDDEDVHMHYHFGYFSRHSRRRKEEEEEEAAAKVPPQLFQLLIPNLEKLSLRGQFDDKQLLCTLNAVSSKMKELKISRSVYGRVENECEDKIKKLPIISTVKVACWSVYAQSDIRKCVHLYPNVETLQLEICKEIVPIVLLNDLAKFENLNELAIISFEKLNMLTTNFSLPLLKKLYFLQPFNNNDICRPTNPLFHQYYIKRKVNYQNIQPDEANENLPEENEELVNITLNFLPFIKMLKETFPNLEELVLAGYMHLAQYNTSLLFEQLQTFIPSVKIYFRDIVTGHMVPATTASK